MMPVQKRQRPTSHWEEDSDIDISEALTKKKAKVDNGDSDEDSDEDDFTQFLQEEITKRNVKSGTKLLKKTRGSKNLTKGEVGGGSWQSMGELRNCTNTTQSLK
jgi:ATP-dependent RNA helicase DDX54/DBP10